MADHQTETPTIATPPETTIIQPRSQEISVETGTPDEKAAREAKERMTKTGGFWNRLAPEKEQSKPDKATAPTEKKKDEQPAVESTPTAEEPPKPDKKQKGRKKEPEIDPLELARATGQEIGREMAKASQTSNVPRGTIPTEPEPEPELPAEFQPDVAVFEEMARLEPKRYGNIKKELSKYATAESEYIAKWESEHEGETYNGDADEHNAFYAKIRPNYDQKDFKLAEKSLLKQEVRREVSEDLRTREAETERRRELASKIQPEVDRDMFDTLGDMVREIDPNNAALTKDWNSLKELDEKNSLLSEVMVNVHNETKPVVTAAMRLFRSVDAYDRNNPVHQRIANVIASAEQELSRLPIKDRYNEGKLFATQDDFSKMSPAEQSKHWYIDEQMTLHVIRGQAISRAKSIYEREDARLSKHSKRANAAQLANQPSAKKPDVAPQQRTDNGSPSVSGRGTLPGDGQPTNGKPTSGRDSFFSRMIGS